MTTILDQLDAAAGSTSWVSFGPTDQDRHTIASMWQRSAGAADWFSARYGEGDTVAMALGATPECLVALFGAWRAGLEVLSVPDPSRVAADTFTSLFEGIVAAHGPVTLLTDPARLASLPEMRSVTVEPFDSALAAGPHGRRESVGSFVQYTSGSTRNPAGVRLGLTELAHATSAIIDRLHGDLRDDTAEVRICSWLPLSHDMGLVGGCLTALVGGGVTRAGTGTVLMEPAAFIRRPTAWLKTCAEIGAAITLSSAHGLDLATRLAPRLEGTDLSSLESILIGGEMIPADTLDRFVAAHAPLGLDPNALRPAYGMAENTLAVSIGRPGDHAHRVANPRAVDPASPSATLVSCGPAVTGTEVRIVAPDADGIGEIAIRGTSLFHGYTGDRVARHDDGWFLTNDLGMVDDGHLVPMGRLDDVIVVRGQNLMPSDVEQAVADALGPTCRNVAAVTCDEGYALVIETRAPDDVIGAAAAIRTACTRAVGVGPDRLVAVSKRGLPLTSSGKVQRSATRVQLLAGELPVTAERSLRVVGT